MVYLMKHGAGIHVRDRNNNTPLMCAINADQRATIQALRACGAHLQVKLIATKRSGLCHNAYLENIPFLISDGFDRTGRKIMLVCQNGVKD